LRACNESEASNCSETTLSPTGVHFGTSWEKFLVNHRKLLESASTMSTVFIAFGLLLMTVNLAIGCNPNVAPYRLEFCCRAYDYYNIGVSTSFIIFNLILTCCTRFHFYDTNGCTREVRTLNCNMIVLAIGFSLASWVFSTKWSVDDRLVITFIIGMTMLLFFQLILNWKLYQEMIIDCSSCTKPSLFDNFTIDDILNSSSMCKQFEHHLRMEFSLENLNFLKICDRYQDLVRHSNDYTGSSGAENDCRDEFLVSFCCSNNLPRRKTTVARYIYEQFCVEGAPQEINLSRKIRRELREFFESNSHVYAKELFDDAVNCIKDLLTHDSLRRFRVESGDFYSRF
jgi:hypothetical protein